MIYSPALLEEWMRKYYYDAKIDIGSSGVYPWSFGELREKLQIHTDELDEIKLMDSTSYGHQLLRYEISERWSNGNPNSVMVTHGSSEGLYLALNSLLNAGDHVIILDPCYHSVESISTQIGCQLTRWYLREENGFKADIDELKKLMKQNTKMLILNFPHNPTGTTITNKELMKIIELASEFDVFLLWDGAFTDLVYDTEPLEDPTKYYKKAISTGTFSKCYGLPGLRFGWCIAAPEILEKFIPLRDRMTLHLSPLVEYVALKTVRNIDTLLHSRLNEVKQNLAYLSNWMNENTKYIEFNPPGGGVTVFPKIKSYIDVEQLCHELGKKYNVLLVPGTCFGNLQRVRLGFGCTARELHLGLSSLEQCLKNNI
ncbi:MULTISPECIES: capreomycidine synthase [Bacillus]|uniref:Capreomycidine synthase n=1 Tax=Bacillus toyonensis TaxID=155322 RepID=A0AAP8JUT4_9BACI|nr:capreomycidine synthase [Bacillus toyonensis]KXY48264.1 hypothetical protein AT265_17060 [Bacillus cereus]PEB89655.1 capreomycidine synthase [Bacillus toyonensis]PEE27746.1 capreomycidine synthase [Bacillus toyonensis]PEF79775.1 capreomycidine synthase [Bacillus toyonensis]PFY18230.1 capreomycidine synthase [Bacillus toyonensis]